MELFEKEALISRISSGYLRCRLKHDGSTILLKLFSPNADAQYIASEVYEDSYRIAKSAGAISKEDALQYLVDLGVWGVSLADELKTLTTKMDDLKLELYNNAYKSNARTTIRQAIKATYKRMDELESIKSQFDYVTAEGIATFTKSSYLILCGIRKGNGERLFADDDDLLIQEDKLTEKIIKFCSTRFIDESEYRELARGEPWNSLYGIAAGTGTIFGKHGIDLTIEQRSLLFWSKVYQNISEHPDSPHRTVIDDDWMLDGWIIKQHRKNEADKKKKVGEEQISGNQKIAGAAEVFIPVDTWEDAKELDMAINTPEARAIIKQRAKFLQGRGEVKESELPDVSRQIQMDLNKMFIQHAKGK